MKSVFWALVRKDIYLMRGFITATLVVGLISLVLAAFGGAAFALGGVLFLTASLGAGIFIAMYTVFTERKEQARMFALTLPVHGAQYDLAKLVGALASYLIPWLLLTLAAMTMLLLPPGKGAGMLVYMLMIQGCTLTLFTVILALLFFVRSETASAMTILGTNIVFSLFMITINQRDVTGSLQLRGTEIIVTPFALKMFAVQGIVLVAALALSYVAVSRQRDHL